MTHLPIVFSPHALDSMRKRGAEKTEVEQAIRSGQWQEARKDRYETKSEFPYQAQWNGKMYATKQVYPVFVVEDDTIIVITVYVFYS